MTETFNKLRITSSERCVCCGAYVPEGVQVCCNCSEGSAGAADYNEPRPVLIYINTARADLPKQSFSLRSSIR